MTDEIIELDDDDEFIAISQERFKDYPSVSKINENTLNHQTFNSKR